MGTGISQSYAREALRWELFSIGIPYILRSGGKALGLSLFTTFVDWLFGGDVQAALFGRSPFRWQVQTIEDTVEDLLLPKAAWEKLQNQQRGDDWLQARQTAGLPAGEMKELWREFNATYARRLALKRDGGGGTGSAREVELEDVVSTSNEGRVAKPSLYSSQAMLGVADGPTAMEDVQSERLREPVWLRSDPDTSDYYTRWAKRSDGSDDVSGWDGLDTVRRRLNIKTRRLAVLVAACRILFWHLLQAGAFFLIFWAYAPLMTNVETALSFVVAAREALYIVFVLGCARHCPAIFLYCVKAEPGPGWLVVYVVCPEKFLISALSNTLRWGNSGWFFIYVCVLCDCCAMAALILFVSSGHFFWPLLLSFFITALSGVAALGFALVKLLSACLDRCCPGDKNPIGRCLHWFGVGTHWTGTW